MQELLVALWAASPLIAFCLGHPATYWIYRKPTIRYSAYIALSSVAFCAGPFLIPHFLYTDPILEVFAHNPDVQAVSGWYGPGAWIVFVLTSLSAIWRMLSLTRHVASDHIFIGCPMQNICEECDRNYRPLDADLTASIVYVSVAAVDLIRHSWRILRADEPHMDESIIPGMQASETAVLVGCGLAHVILFPLVFLIYTLPHTQHAPTLGFRVMYLYWRRLLPSFTLLLIASGGLFISYRSKAVLFATDDNANSTLTPKPNMILQPLFGAMQAVERSFLELSRFFILWGRVKGTGAYLTGFAMQLVLSRGSGCAVWKHWPRWAQLPATAVLVWFMPLIAGMSCFLFAQVCPPFRLYSSLTN
jgi:hypothetical protein